MTAVKTAKARRRSSDQRLSTIHDAARRGPFVATDTPEAPVCPTLEGTEVRSSALPWRHLKIEMAV
jgi:hypothetical protein